MAEIKKRVYRFGGKHAEGNGKMRELLGGKGANLAEMNLLGMPVPAGFTITTECCTEYYRLGGGKWSTKIPQATKAGEYTVTWYLKADENYTSDSSAAEPARSRTR